MIVGMREVVDRNSSGAYFPPGDCLFLEIVIEPLLRYLLEDFARLLAIFWVAFECLLSVHRVSKPAEFPSMGDIGISFPCFCHLLVEIPRS